MSTIYNYTEKLYPARPRSKRVKNQGGYVSGNGVITDNSVGAIGVTSHNELIGVVSTVDEYSEFSQDIHLTADAAKELERLSKIKVIESTDNTTEPTDQTIYSSLKSDKEFLRKTITGKQTVAGAVGFESKLTMHNGVSVTGGTQTDTLHVSREAQTSTLRVSGDTQTGSLHVSGNATTGTLDVDVLTKTKDLQVGELARTRDMVVTHLAEILNLSVTDVATLAKTIVKESAGSEMFIPGFTGEGFKIWKLAAGWNLEIDTLTIRKTLTAFELLISRVRAVNGALAITTANGKVKNVVDQNTFYSLEIEDTMSFVAGDLVRCQTWKTSGSKYFWVTVTRVEGNAIVCAKSEFDGVVPSTGDELVQMGHASDPDRQNMIYLDASSGRPVIDVLSGINTKSFDGKMKVRLGCLDGIADRDFPSAMQPSGYGLYCANGFFKGMFVLRSGKTVEDGISEVQSAADRANASIVQINTELSAIPGLITLAVNAIQVGGRNLLVDTASRTTPFSATGNYAYLEFTPSVKIKPDTDYTFSIDSSEILQGVGFNAFTVIIYDRLNIAYPASFTVPISSSRIAITIRATVNIAPNANIRVLIYSGISGATAGKQLKLTNFKLEEGNKATAWSPSPEEVSADIKIAKDAADKAQTDANMAKGTADAATNRLTAWAADGTISPTEKLALKQEQNALWDERLQIIADAAKYSVSSTAYATAHTNYNAELTYHTTATPENIAIRATFNTYQTAYYTAKQAVLNAIATAAKSYVDTKSSTEAGKVRTELGSRITATEREIALKVSSDTFNALGQRVSSAETGISQNARDIALRATKVELEGIDTRLKSAEIKVQPDQINLVVKSPKITTVTVDALALDVNTYYPVTIALSNYMSTFNIKVVRGLDRNYGKPSWSIHSGGFSMDFEWESNGSGWGAMVVNRTIYKTAFSFTTNSTTYPAGRIGQLANSSQEYIYVRGGSKYDVIVEGRENVGITLHPTGYSANSQALGLLGISDITAIVPDLQQRPTTTAIQEGITVREDVISVFGKDIFLKGKVTFEAFNSVTQDKITSAQNAANQAQSTANAAKKTAEDARDRLGDWALDSTISPTEKLALKQEQKALADEKAQIVADAAKYDVSSVVYTTAYNNYNGELAYHTTSVPENITIRPAFATSQAVYYTAKQTILNAIATAVKKLASDAKDAANAALIDSRNDVATKLGYTSYTDMVGAATANKTLINGGYINTTLIKTEDLFATRITTGNLSLSVGAKLGSFDIKMEDGYTNIVSDTPYSRFKMTATINGTNSLYINPGVVAATGGIMQISVGTVSSNGILAVANSSLSIAGNFKSNRHDAVALKAVNVAVSGATYGIALDVNGRAQFRSTLGNNYPAIELYDGHIANPLFAAQNGSGSVAMNDKVMMFFANHTAASATYTLPAPKNGKILFFRNNTDNKTIISSGSYTIKYSVTSTTKSIDLPNGGSMAVFTSDGSFWYYNRMLW